MAKLNASELQKQTAIAQLIGCLGNADIRWDGTLVGLNPVIVSDSARQLLAFGDMAIAQLVVALEEESKFVVAHVLLTLLSRVEHLAAPWNGLSVDLSPAGQARFDARQRFELGRRWRAWQQVTPRLRSLPE